LFGAGRLRVSNADEGEKGAKRSGKLLEIKQKEDRKS